MMNPTKDATTITEILSIQAKSNPDTRWLTYINSEEEEHFLTYGELLELSRQFALSLRQRGVVRGLPVPIILPTSQEFLYVFFGILLLGAIPVPLYPPVRIREMEGYTKQLQAILRDCGARVLITSTQMSTVMRWITRSVKARISVVAVEDLTVSEYKDLDPSEVTPEDTALVQYTSGSTGQPKGVELTHQNLLSNIRAISIALEYREGDVGISWLPLYHDMGLIGAIMSTLYFTIPLVLFSPIDFIRQPKRWLWAIHKYRGSISAAPNFAYSLCARKIKDHEIEGLDLSSWRLAIDGAESIHLDTLDRFTDRFGPYGFSKRSFLPSYGLAENALAVSFESPDNEPLIRSFDRKVFEMEGRAVPVSTEGGDSVRWVSVGRPVPGHSVQIMGDSNREAPTGTIGRVRVSGPSMMKGYFRQPLATEEVIQSGWLDTGDLGFIADGNLYITGRSKDLIIKGGRNYYPQDIEASAGLVGGIRPGYVCAFGMMDGKMGTEKIVVIAETRIKSPGGQTKIISEIKKRVHQEVGVSPDHVRLVPPGSVPKTSSGKVQRSLCRERFLKGKISRSKIGTAWTLVRLYLRSFVRSSS